MIFGQKVFSNRFYQFYENDFGIKKENDFETHSPFFTTFLKAHH